MGRRCQRHSTLLRILLRYLASRQGPVTAMSVARALGPAQIHHPRTAHGDEGRGLVTHLPEERLYGLN
ncbi:MAG: hypothetical protein R2693_02625 [Nocardioidaceae bacterium]